LLAGGVGIVTGFNWLGLAGIFICALSNASFLALLFRVGGARALVGGFVLHFCYYIYSSVSFAAIAAHNVLASQTRSFEDTGSAAKVRGYRHEFP
jgi:hypothetical protein